MDLNDHYNLMHADGIRKMATGRYFMDPFLHPGSDNRFGISLLIRPVASVIKNFQSFVESIRAIDPNQYFYPDTDMHVTLLSIISCTDGFNLQAFDKSGYISIIKKSLVGIKPFNIRFCGVAAAPEGLVIRGFPEDSTLNTLRDRLRLHFKASALLHSIDKRYTISTAHCTVVRFKNQLQQKAAWMEQINRFILHDFGTAAVTGIELVYNDWYQRAALVKRLHLFGLSE